MKRAKGPAKWASAPLSPAAFYGCFGILAVLGLALLVQRHVLWARDYPLYYARAWLAAGLAALIFSALILWLDRYEREPKRLLLVAFVWGAVAAPGILWTSSDMLEALRNTRVTSEVSGFVQDYNREHDPNAPGKLVSGVVNATLDAVRVTQIGPFVEELSKAAVVFLIFLLLPHEFDGLLDGLVYGALVGLGFAMGENVQYLVRAQIRSANPELARDAFLGMVRSRIFFHGLTGHAMYTGLAGAGLGLARTASREWLHWSGPPLGFALAVVAHMTWNSLPGRDPLTRLIDISGPMIVVLVGILVLSMQRERRVLDYLPDAGKTPYSSPEIILHRKARWQAQWRAFRRYGLKGLRAAAGLQRTLIEWAYLRWHWAEGHPAEGVDTEEMEGRYRVRVDALVEELSSWPSLPGSEGSCR